MLRSYYSNQFETLSEKTRRMSFVRFFFIGLLMPLGFAPFHLPGLAILGLALFYYNLTDKANNAPFLSGLMFGLGFFGLGISWIYISIHDYGHLHGIVAALITLVFLLYLSLFPAVMAHFFCRITKHIDTLFSGLVFSAFWIAFEFIRANFLTGFPWLLLGFGQFDTPIKYLLPILGLYGSGFIACFAATLLAISLRSRGKKRLYYLVTCVSLILFALAFQPIRWGHEEKNPISVGIIQANMSMRDKLDEDLFWQLLQRYQQDTESLLGTQLIVLPESAIPLPASYIGDFLTNLHEEAKRVGSAILLGIPQPTTVEEDYYYNSLISLGHAKGSYLKQHLVPFGEYIPNLFLRASSWLGIPDANLKSGRSNQSLIKVHNHPIASLICYELGYSNLLRQQLPSAKWIVSISDDGWFGHSLALYQQQQMAQALSLLSARYQVVANNDGLSSIINTQGDVVSSLPAFNEGILKSQLFPSKGITPWVSFGDTPILLFSLLIIVLALIQSLFNGKVSFWPIAAKNKRRYPYQPL